MPKLAGALKNKFVFTLSYEPPPKKRLALFSEGWEILKLAPGFRRYGFFCQNFQEEVEESSGRSLSLFFPIDLTIISPIH